MFRVPRMICHVVRCSARVQMIWMCRRLFVRRQTEGYFRFKIVDFRLGVLRGTIELVVPLSFYQLATVTSVKLVSHSFSCNLQSEIHELESAKNPTFFCFL